ncbi:MAG: 16S rRNA (uracil(1498)-N(3))-methyltransferase [Pseudomonadota bacterium]
MAKPPPRLYTKAPLREGETFHLDRDQAHYLVKVLRLKAGDDVLLFNGQEGEWRGQLCEVSRKQAQVVLKEQTRPQISSPPITLLFAPVKKGPTDFIIQKATELGVSAFHPITTARTITNRISKDRFEAIAIEAAEQCERLDVPELHGLTPLEDALAQLGASTILYADEAGDSPTMRWGGQTGHAPLGNRAFSSLSSQAPSSPSSPWALLVGPEGGFTPEERQMLRAKPNVLPIHLGPRILKAETAVIVGLTLWQANIGDMT